MVEDKFKCRVCGLSHFPDMPWGEDGNDRSYLICDCCGVEFGYDDEGLQLCLWRRHHWVEVEHCRWFWPKSRPADWDIAAQIRGIPQAYKGVDDERLIQAYLDAGEPPLRGLTALSAAEKKLR